MLKELLEEKKCFKLVLGAGNEDIVKIAKLIRFYYDIGCRFFDLGANAGIIEMGQKLAPDASFCASFAVSGDRHILKAKINEKKCIRCGKCYSICPQEALHKNFRSCIGCGACKDICENNAIEFYESSKNFEENLDKIVSLGIDCIELHAKTTHKDEIFEKWQYICENFNGIMSICVGLDEINLVEELLKNRKPYTTIIQADGKSMSGTNNKKETTMPAVLCAKAYSELDLPAYIIPSGGTNSKTYDLLLENKVNFAGIAYGTFARNVKNKEEAEKLLKPLYKKTVEIHKK